MKYIPIIALACMLAGCSFESPDLIDDEPGSIHGVPKLLYKVSAQQIESRIGGIEAPLYGVAVYFFSYFGEKGIPMSGVIGFPMDGGQISRDSTMIWSYQHGSIAAQMRAPSQALQDEMRLTVTEWKAARMRGEIVEYSEILLRLVSEGFVVVIPDGQGFGFNGLSPHIYLDIDAMGRPVVNALRAARIQCIDLDVPCVDEVSVLGYSEGANASKAAQLIMETEYRSEFPRIYGAGGGGAWSLDGVSLDSALVGRSLQTHPGLMAYVAYGWFNGAQPKKTELDDIFNYPEIIESFFYNNYDLTLSGVINDSLKALGPVFKDDFLAAVEQDPNHEFRLWLKKNSLDKHMLKDPFEYWHCRGDEVVSDANLLAMVEHHTNQNWPIEYFHIQDKILNHNECGRYVLPRMSMNLWDKWLNNG